MQPRYYYIYYCMFKLLRILEKQFAIRRYSQSKPVLRYIHVHVHVHVHEKIREPQLPRLQGLDVTKCAVCVSSSGKSLSLSLSSFQALQKELTLLKVQLANSQRHSLQSPARPLPLQSQPPQPPFTSPQGTCIYMYVHACTCTCTCTYTCTCKPYTV